MGETPKQLAPFVFSKENQPANRGRKPGILGQITRLTGEEFKISLTRNEKHQLIESVLERTPSELQELVDNPEMPAFIIAIAKAMLKDIELASIATVETLFDRVFGRPKQDVSQTIKGEVDFIVNYDKLNEPKIIDNDAKD